jgi:CheY-like chemotaxis protein
LPEDNIVNQRLISRILEKMGHAVIVNDGAAALHMLSQQEFDLIAMDMQMPVIDGIEATIENSPERIRHVGSYAYCRYYGQRL